MVPGCPKDELECLPSQIVDERNFPFTDIALLHDSMESQSFTLVETVFVTVVQQSVAVLTFECCVGQQLSLADATMDFRQVWDGHLRIP